MARQPKKKCCSDKPRCARCPIRMLAEDRLPPGYAVHKRRLVKVGEGVPDAKADKHGKRTKSGKGVKASKGVKPGKHAADVNASTAKAAHTTKAA